MVAVFDSGRQLGILAGSGCLLTAVQPGQAEQPVTVLAASNLMAVLDPLAHSFGAEHGVPVRVINGPSQILELQF
jgi:ABC-type molybdate transport system substrate-binding protein